MAATPASPATAASLADPPRETEGVASEAGVSGAHHQWWLASSTFNFSKRAAPKHADAPEDLVLFDEFCSVCQRGGTLVVCDGVCRRAFHASCVGIVAVETSDEPYLCSVCSIARDAVLRQLDEQAGEESRPPVPPTKLTASIRALMLAHTPQEVHHVLNRFSSMSSTSSSPLAATAQPIVAAADALIAAVSSPAGSDDYSLGSMPLWTARLELLAALHAAHAAASEATLRAALLRRFETVLCAYNHDAFARYTDTVLLPSILASTARATPAAALMALFCHPFLCASLCAMNVCERVGIAVAWKRCVTAVVSRVCAPVTVPDLVAAVRSPTSPAGDPLDDAALDAVYDAFLASAYACIGADVDTHCHVYEHAMQHVRARAGPALPATCARIVACASEFGAMPVAHGRLKRELVALEAVTVSDCACAPSPCACVPACPQLQCSVASSACGHTFALLRAAVSHVSAYDEAAFASQFSGAQQAAPKRATKGRKRSKRANDADDAVSPLPEAAPPQSYAASPFTSTRGRLTSDCAAAAARVCAATAAASASQLRSTWALHTFAMIAGALADSYSSGAAVHACIRGFGPSQAYTTALFTDTEPQPETAHGSLTSATLLRIRALYYKDSELHLPSSASTSLLMCEDALDEALRAAEAVVKPFLPSAAGAKRGRPPGKKGRKSRGSDDDNDSDDGADEVITARERRAGARVTRPVLQAAPAVQPSPRADSAPEVAAVATSAAALVVETMPVGPEAAGAHAAAGPAAVDTASVVNAPTGITTVSIADANAEPAAAAPEASATSAPAMNTSIAPTSSAAFRTPTDTPLAAPAAPTVLSSVLARLRGSAATAAPPASPPAVPVAPAAPAAAVVDPAAAAARLKLSAHMRDGAVFLQRYSAFLRSLPAATASHGCSCEADMLALQTQGYVLLCSRGEQPCTCPCVCGRPRVKWTVATHAHVHSMLTDDRSKQVLPLAAANAHAAMMCGLTASHSHGAASGSLRRVNVRGGRVLLAEDAALQLVCGCVCRHACDEVFTSSAAPLAAFVTTFTARILAAKSK